MKVEGNVKKIKNNVSKFFFAIPVNLGAKSKWAMQTSCETFPCLRVAHDICQNVFFWIHTKEKFYFVSVQFEN